MKEMLLLGAKIMSKEEIINQLEEAIKEYKIIDSKDNESKIVLFSQMFSMKLVMERNNMSVADVIADIDHTEKMTSVFNKESKN